MGLVEMRMGGRKIANAGPMSGAGPAQTRQELTESFFSYGNAIADITMRLSDEPYRER